MATPGGIRAGRAYVEIAGDSSKLQAALNVAASKLANFGAKLRTIGITLSAAGSAITAPLGFAIHQFEQMGSAFKDMSDRTGMSIKRLSELGFAAQQSGSSLEDLEIATRKMQKAIVDGDDALTTLHLSADRLIQLSPDDQFRAVAQAIVAIEDPTKRAAAALDLFGKSGTKTLTFLRDIDKHAKRLRELGGVFTEDDANQADAIGDSIGEVNAAIAGLSKKLAKVLGPSVVEAATKLADMIAVAGDFIKANPELVTGAAAVGVALSAIGAAAYAAGLALPAVAAAVTLLGTAISFALSPFGLILAAFVAIAWKSGIAEKAFKKLQEVFPELKKAAEEALGAIGKALCAGELQLAAEFAFAGLEVAWLMGVDALKDIWTDFLEWLASSQIDIWFGVQKQIEKLRAGALAGAAKVTSGVTEVAKQGQGFAQTFGAHLFQPLLLAEFGKEAAGAMAEGMKDWAADVQDIPARQSAAANKLAIDLAEIEKESARRLTEIEKQAGEAKRKLDEGRAAAGGPRAPGEALAAALKRFEELKKKIEALPPPGEEEEEGGGRNQEERIKKTLEALDATLGTGGPRATFAQERAAFNAESIGLQERSLAELRNIERNTRGGGLRIA